MRESKKFYFAVICIDFLVIIVGLFSEHITNLMFKYMTCVFYRNGILCPSCGGTRCIRALFRFEFLKSFSYNPFVFTVAVYGIVLLFFANLGYIFNLSFAKKTFKAMSHYILIIVVATGYALFGILRNFI